MGGLKPKRWFFSTYILLGILSSSLSLSPLVETSAIEDLTDDTGVRVEFSQQSVSSSGGISRSRGPQSTAPSNNRPSTPSNNRSSTSSNNSSQTSRDMPARFSQTSRNSAEGSTICLSRSQWLARDPEDRVCDPEPSTDVPVQQPVPAVNSQPQVVEEPVEIVITASDLLELIPASPEILMDRGPFGLKNAHTNFYASNHTPQTVTQTMFDQEVTITATPIEYRWDYGDGDSLVTELPGHPVDVFNTETDTSHQYTDTGLYSVGLTTVFEGTYQVDGGETQMVSSTVTQQAAPVEIRIWRAVTRNVDQTCEQDPQAWGC